MIKRYATHSTGARLFCENRLCTFTGNPEFVQQTEGADLPEHKPEAMKTEVHAESIEADVRRYMGEAVSRADAVLHSLKGALEQTDKRISGIRQTLAAIDATGRLSPDQPTTSGQLDKGTATDRLRSFRATGRLGDSNQVTLDSFAAKLGPEMCKRLGQRAPLTADDVRQLATVLPTLSREEMDLFMGLPILPAGMPLTEEDRRIFETFPTMSREDQAKVIMALPIRAEEQHTQQNEQRESAEVARKARGFITDAAMEFLQRNGYLNPGQGIGKLESRLNISGHPDQVNYTAIGSTLYVEAIGPDGSAQKFAVPMGGSVVENLKTVVKSVLNRKQDTQEKPDAEKKENEKIIPIDTYKTTKIAAIFTKSPDSNRSVADYYVKTTGRLPDLPKEADRNNIIIEHEKPSAESNTLATKDGQVLASATESINDRDRWEEAMTKMVEDALSRLSGSNSATVSHTAIDAGRGVARSGHDVVGKAPAASPDRGTEKEAPTPAKGTAGPEAKVAGGAEKERAQVVSLERGRQFLGGLRDQYHMRGTDYMNADGLTLTLDSSLSEGRFQGPGQIAVCFNGGRWVWRNTQFAEGIRRGVLGLGTDFLGTDKRYSGADADRINRVIEELDRINRLSESAAGKS
jgi:hypothetical protein